jgi:hypothetical protein
MVNQLEKNNIPLTSIQDAFTPPNMDGVKASHNAVLPNVNGDGFTLNEHVDVDTLGLNPSRKGQWSIFFSFCSFFLRYHYFYYFYYYYCVALIVNCASVGSACS